MAGSAPKLSVTGFQRSLTKKPKPKVRSAGSEPLISETMTPLSSNSTPMAAARVRWRNAMSPSRNRSSALVRARASAGTKPWPDNAISTTDCLRAGCMSSPCARSFRRATQAALRSRQKPLFALSGKGKRRLPQRLFPRAKISVNRLAVGTFDLVFPGLLDQRHDVIGHRHVIEVGRHLLAVLIAPIEELQGFGRRRDVGRNRLHQDEGRASNRPGLFARRVGDDDAE